ncbi:HNH endonuclease signature motif containing protein [Phycicoccus flavus]|uniref:HNH endonuclease signature motif containing protein n=1 Tax=Phycicoccus flavus TaxID=2502783 RepID=UPI000FEBC976|nr:HNH endonuclease signature motif containing protein [Phycicoccus flavus]NHA69414.1 DUF222 domain-containing protein [Phycicoccus flavus]
MDRGDVSNRIAALRGDAVLLAKDLAENGRSLDPREAFEVAGELQGVINAAEGAQAVAAAFGARFECRMVSDRVIERTHPVGFVDGMAPSMLAMEAGVTEGVAGRKVRLGAKLSARFPQVLELVLDGEVAAVTAHKVLDATAGLDVEACLRMDASLAPRLAAMDPARVSSETRRIAARVAADQVAEHAAKTLKVRTVEVCPSEDGLTEWFALLPTATSRAAWSAVESLAAEYRGVDDTLSVPESRADAFGDLLLRNVTVNAQVTLGVPVVTAAPDPAPVPTVRTFSPRDPDETIIDATTGEEVRIGDLPADTQEDLGWYEFADYDTESGSGVPTAVEMAPTRLGTDTGATAFVSGVQLPGLGWVDATTVAGILSSLPLQVARAVLDAHTGTLASITTDAYRPPARMRQLVTTRDGTCRMYGCRRPAERCDLDHVRPWPAGPTTPANLAGLCRRHHRLKQQGHWRPTLHPDGTLTWTDPSGRTRTTEPAHRTVPESPPTSASSKPPRELSPRDDAWDDVPIPF